MGKITGLDKAGITIMVTPTLTTAAYTTHDCVGGLMTFSDAARVTGGGGTLTNIVVVDDGGQDSDMELWLFDDEVTEVGDHDRFIPAEAELHSLIAIVALTTAGWKDAGTPSAQVQAVALRFDATGNSLYGQLVTRGEPTYLAVDDLTVRLSIEQA